MGKFKAITKHKWPAIALTYFFFLLFVTRVIIIEKEQYYLVC